MPLYTTINNFLIKYISEVTFILVTLIYIFTHRYVFLFLEKIIRGMTNAIFENKDWVAGLLKYIDSFFVFILSFLIIIPFGKILLEKYLEPYLKNEYLTWIFLGTLAFSYLYYTLFYSKHLHGDK